MYVFFLLKMIVRYYVWFTLYKGYPIFKIVLQRFLDIFQKSTVNSKEAMSVEQKFYGHLYLSGCWVSSVFYLKNLAPTLSPFHREICSLVATSLFLEYTDSKCGYICSIKPAFSNILTNQFSDSRHLGVLEYYIT